MRPLSAALLLAIAAPAAASAQTAPIDARVGRLEKEMRAVQRKVFPQGAPGYFEPEITSPEAPPPVPAGNPATPPITDLTARVDSLEQELARVTGQVEQQGFKLRQIEEAMARLKAETGSRLDVLEGRNAASAPDGGPPPPQSGRTPPPPSGIGSTNSMQAYPEAPGSTAPGSAAVAAADPAEDAYMAGYRAWMDKDYAKAETLLKDVAAKYPKSRRASYAQNLLGRSYLDEGKPAAAARALFDNYRTNPRGERAPDSLYWLGQSLMRLDKPNPAKACEAYDQLTRDYGETISAQLKDRVAAGRKDAKCDASPSAAG